MTHQQHELSNLNQVVNFDRSEMVNFNRSRVVNFTGFCPKVCILFRVSIKQKRYWFLNNNSIDSSFW